MDVGLLRKLMAAPAGRVRTPIGMRDHVLAAMLACAAASGGRLTQTRVLSLRVDDVPHAVAGLPFSAKVCELVRELVRVAGLSGGDPVAWSRKRGSNGRRRAVSRVQAYRVVRARTGHGWSGTVRRLVATGGGGAGRVVRPPPPVEAVGGERPTPTITPPRPIGLQIREALGLWNGPTPRPPPRGG